MLAQRFIRGFKMVSQDTDLVPQGLGIDGQSPTAHDPDRGRGVSLEVLREQSQEEHRVVADVASHLALTLERRRPLPGIRAAFGEN